MENYTLRNKPLSKCTYYELIKEWEAGMWMDVQEGLSEKQSMRLNAVEKAMDIAFNALSDEEKKNLDLVNLV